MEKKTLATAAVASTLGGALAGATLLAPGLAGAQDDTTDESTEETTTEETTGTDTGDRPEAGERITEVLQGLVDDGTLTQDQLDAVVETLVAAQPERGGRGHGGLRGSIVGGADLAEVLGIEQSALREAIVGGQSLADIAAEQGIDTQALVDALVDAAEERVATAVENGRIDEEQAEEALSNAAEKAEELVNGEFSFEGRRGPGGQRGGAGAESTPEADADA